MVRHVIISFSFDQTLDERNSRRYLSGLWALFKKHMDTTGRWKDGMKLGSNGRPLTLFLASEEPCWEFFSMEGVATPSMALEEVKVHYDDLQLWGGTRQVADAWVQQAFEEVQKFFAPRSRRR